MSGLELLLLAYHLICIPMAHEYWSVLVLSRDEWLLISQGKPCAHAKDSSYLRV